MLSPVSSSLVPQTKNSTRSDPSGVLLYVQSDYTRASAFGTSVEVMSHGTYVPVFLCVQYKRVYSMLWMCIFWCCWMLVVLYCLWDLCVLLCIYVCLHMCVNVIYAFMCVCV